MKLLDLFTQDVPAEFRGWIDGLKERFAGAFAAIEAAATDAYNAYLGEKDAVDPVKKKDFALYATAQDSSLTPILFAMLCGKQYAPIIWKQIRPRGDERPFKVDEA